MLEFMKGKKTYLIMIVGVILNGLVAMEIIGPEFIGYANTILGFLGLGALRAGVKK